MRLPCTLAVLGIVATLLGCSGRIPAENTYNSALRLYSSHKDDSAVALLQDATAPGQAELGLLADLLALNAYYKGNKEAAEKSLQVSLSLTETNGDTGRQYDHYIRAIANEALGKTDIVAIEIRQACPGSDCPLIENLTNDALLMGERYDAERLFAVTSILMKQGHNSDNVLAGFLASSVLLNHKAAESQMRLLQQRQPISPTVSEAYCAAIDLIRTKEPLSTTETMLCGANNSFKPKPLRGSA